MKLKSKMLLYVLPAPIVGIIALTIIISLLVMNMGKTSSDVLKDKVKYFKV